MDSWADTVEKAIEAFAKKHASTFSRSERQLHAAFEIGCFLAIVRCYERRGFACSVENLRAGQYPYLTTPSGNPANYSFVRATLAEEVEIRQQVRVRSHLDPDIAFTPDIIVVRAASNISGIKDADYSGGKRRLFCVNAADVVAAHECKSCPPWPELLVSFVGMLIAAHPWLGSPNDRSMVDKKGDHLAPTLFVGGTARALHRRMVKALCGTYPMNAILGMHFGTWELEKDTSDVAFIRYPLK